MIATLLLAAGLLAPLLLLSGIVSGSETALFGISHAGRAKLRHDSAAAARAVEELLGRPRPLLTALLAANMLINVSYFSISSIFVVQLESGDHASAAAMLAIGSLVAIILLGEIGAKLLASTYPVLYCRLIAPPWLVILRVGWPVLSQVDRAVLRPLIRMVGQPAASTRVVRRSSDTLAGVLTTAVEVEASEATSDQRLILGVIRLGRTRVREVMTPRSQVATLTAGATHEQAIGLFRDRNNVLLLDERGSEPIGWLHAPTYLLGSRSGGARRSLASLTSPCVFLPEQSTLDSALERLRTTQRDRAVVVDERGEFVGVVRVEDIASQMLDEPGTPESREIGQPTLVGLGVFEVPGRWPAKPLLIDLDIPHDEADRVLSRVSTVGGLMLALLGRFPEPGDSARLHAAELTVTGIEGREITRVQIRFENAAEGGGGDP